MTARRRRRNVKNVKMFKSNDDALSYYLSQLKGGTQPKKQVEEGLIFKADSSLTAPYAHLSCKPKYVKENEYVIFDASKSIDCNNEPVKKYIFNFGDNTKKSTSFDPIIQHKYKYSGQYIVSLTVIDDFGKRDTIKLVKRIGNVNDYTESESTNENTQNSEYSDDDDDDDGNYVKNIKPDANITEEDKAMMDFMNLKM
eukprot:330613_1